MANKLKKRKQKKAPGGIMLAMRLRCKRSKMKHRTAERGGSKNKQREFADEAQE
jgi:hypothetical protein